MHGKTYFQLHRNEVVRQVEMSLNSTVTVAAEAEAVAAAGDTTAQTQTPASTMSQLVVRMWQPDVYLPTQTAEFLRLTLDLVARFRAWVHEYFCCQEEQEQKDNVPVPVPLARRVVAIAEAQKFTEEYVLTVCPSFLTNITALVAAPVLAESFSLFAEYTGQSLSSHSV